jgi:hypothetical protein
MQMWCVAAGLELTLYCVEGCVGAAAAGVPGMQSWEGGRETLMSCVVCSSNVLLLLLQLLCFACLLITSAHL